MANYKIILNPTSSRGQSVEDIPLIKEYMEKHDLAYEMVLTERPMSVAAI